MPLALVILKKISLFRYSQKIKPVIPLFQGKKFRYSYSIIPLQPPIMNEKWMTLKCFYCFRMLTIAHKAFYKLDLDEVNRLVVLNPSSYNLRKSLNVNLFPGQELSWAEEHLRIELQ